MITLDELQPLDVNGTTTKKKLAAPAVPGALDTTPAPAPVTADETGFVGSTTPGDAPPITIPPIDAPEPLTPFAGGKGQVDDGSASVSVKPVVNSTSITPTQTTPIEAPTPTTPSRPSTFETKPREPDQPFSLIPEPVPVWTPPVQTPLLPKGLDDPAATPMNRGIVEPVDVPLLPPPEIATETPRQGHSRSAQSTGPNAIDPSNDLRGQVINEDDDRRTKDYSDAVDTAAKHLPTDTTGRSNTLRDDYLKTLGNTDVDLGPDISTGASDRLNKYGSMLDDSVNGLNQVDRVKMARDMYQQFLDEQAPQDALDRKRRIQFAASTGGLRSGRLRNSIGDLETDIENRRGLERRKLISDATSGSIQDQYNKAGFLRDTGNDLAGQERATRDELRTDRNFNTGVKEANIGRRMSSLGAATDAGRTGADTEANAAYRSLDAKRGLESGARAANANRLAATRGERDYENLMENSAYQRRVAQYQAEQAAKAGDLQQALSLLSAGEYGNPSDVLSRLSQEGGMDPAMIAALAQSLGNRGGSGAPATSGGGDGSPIPDDILKSVIDSISSKVRPPSNLPD